MGNRRSRSTARHQRTINRLSGVAFAIACLITVAAVWSFLKSRGMGAKPASVASNSGAVIDPSSDTDSVARDPGQTVRAFLTARSVPELSKFGRMDDNSTTLIRQFGPQIIDWNKGQTRCSSLHGGKANGLTFSAFRIDHTSEPTRFAYVVQTPFGPRIDIGAFLAWSSTSWDRLSTGKDTQATTVRALASRASHYQSRFSDASAWQSFRLASHDGSASVYGYARRGTNTCLALDRLLSKDTTTAFPVIVSLDQGEAGSTNCQFRIARVLAAGWAMGFEILEDNLPKLDDNTLLRSIPIPDPTGPS